MEASFRKFPRFLREFRLTMRSLQGFSDAATPVFADFGKSNPAFTEATRELTPFSEASTVALKSLGATGEVAGPLLREADPILRKTTELAKSGAAPTTNLAEFFTSLEKTKGWDGLVELIYNTTASFNGFDQYGHFARSLVTLTNCTDYIGGKAGTSGCVARFTGPNASTSSSASSSTALLRRIQRRAATPDRWHCLHLLVVHGCRQGRPGAGRRQDRRHRPAPQLPPGPMRNRSGLQGVASSPVLVGAVTVLVVIVAVFLAYNANNGLPFVSTYNLKARVPNADALVKGNEVRIGGVRVGIVKSVVPIQVGNGRVAAELDLSLDKSVEPLPVDSTMMIRPKSALGLKYLQITPGNSSKGFAAGETIPASSAHPEPVDIDQFFDMFDEKTRVTRSASNLAGFGNALAGRGPQLNEAIGALRRLVRTASRCCARSLRQAPTSAASGGRSRTSRPPSPRSPRRRPASSSPSTAPSPPSPASPVPSSRKRSPRALRRSTPPTPTCRCCGPSCTTPNASSSP